MTLTGIIREVGRESVQEVSKAADAVRVGP